MEAREVDPRTLRLPPSRASGPDPAKLAAQIALHGSETRGMPMVWVYRGADGALVIYGGVTRACRIAKLLPGLLITVEIVGDLPGPCGQSPTGGDYFS